MAAVTIVRRTETLSLCPEETMKKTADAGQPKNGPERAAPGAANNSDSGRKRGRTANAAAPLTVRLWLKETLMEPPRAECGSFCAGKRRNFAGILCGFQEITTHCRCKRAAIRRRRVSSGVPFNTCRTARGCCSFRRRCRRRPEPSPSC